MHFAARSQMKLVFLQKKYAHSSLRSLQCLISPSIYLYSVSDLCRVRSPNWGWNIICPSFSPVCRSWHPPDLSVRVCCVRASTARSATRWQERLFGEFMLLAECQQDLYTHCVRSLHVMDVQKTSNIIPESECLKYNKCGMLKRC
jgi:hypothetical protein